VPSIRSFRSGAQNNRPARFREAGQINTGNWTPALVDPATSNFVSNATVFATFARALTPGSGITLYTATGTKIAHLYPGIQLQGVHLTPTLGYAFVPTLSNLPGTKPRIPNETGGRELLFNPTTGKPVGQTAESTTHAPQLVYTASPDLINRR
jgi:hypothetical protein